ncbi:MAG: glycosyl hydrolase family 28-related protein [Pseudomonadota bacterium]
MNKVVTDGIVLMPPAFIDGLDVWSSLDGRPGDPTLDAATNVAIVPADGDFGDCLEVVKTAVTEQIRYTAQTPILPGCYLRVSARVKLVSGNKPSVRIGAFAGDGAGAPVSGLDLTGPAVFLEEFGRIYTVTAIVGTGSRTGVDLPWGLEPTYGHFGIDLIGDTGGAVRVDSIEITDATDAFHRTLMDWVDVRDYGAVGDGVIDDRDAFAAADADAGGRDLLVPEGTYFIGSNLTLDAKVRFEGVLSSASTGRIALTHTFDFATYMDAFNDEQVALERALEALYNFTGHESLNLNGRRIQLHRPIDVAAVVRNVTSFANRRVIRNGQLEALESPEWDAAEVTASASWTSDDSVRLTGVANIAAIDVGSHVSGAGVGREVYVRSKNEAAGTLTLSQPLHGPAATQSYTFTRFRYLLDFSGFDTLSRQGLFQLEFLCNRRASGVLLASSGIAWHIKDSWFVRPKDRGITSFARGCNGMTVEGNEFLSPESTELVQFRTAIALNTNSNDMKIRNNRIVQFRHFAVIAGGGHQILGNHWWQGDDATLNGERSAGLVLTQKSAKTTVTGNYCDNAFIELSNEHSAQQSNAQPYGALTIVGNIFTAQDVPNWFTYIRLAPYGSAQTIDGISVVGNTFKMNGGDLIFRVDGVDTSNGDFDFTRTRGLEFRANTYEEVIDRTEAPAYVEAVQVAPDATWTVPVAPRLPFGAQARAVESFAVMGAVTDGSGAIVREVPIAVPAVGTGGDSVRLDWSVPVSGTVALTVRAGGE